MVYDSLSLSGTAITQQRVLDFLRLDESQAQMEVLQIAQTAAMEYIKNYTGMDEDELRGSDDVTIAFLILVQDFYDNRTMHPDTKYANSANRVVTSILDMHRRNLL